MTSFKAIRDPVADRLPTPQSAALVIIDFQPVQVSSIQSRPKREPVANVTALVRIGKLHDLPVMLSSVNVKTGHNQPTIHQIVDVLSGITPIDRTSINAREDEDFVRAAKATGRKKLIMVALWTEVCLVRPALDVLRDGFEVHRLRRRHLVRSARTRRAASGAGGWQADRMGTAHPRTATRPEPREDHGRIRGHSLRG
ncbi:isochorismatase family protein [Rudaea sp.]|uniref:isochorismatase family protein n=1 Tax=Rudaea sp. TaxID=2136325 RepID=UPI0032202EE2